MPYMRTDLQKIMGHQFSEEKIQYLIYQVLKGLKVSLSRRTLERNLVLSDAQVDYWLFLSFSLWRPVKSILKKSEQT